MQLEFKKVFFIGVLSGIVLSYTYINPFFGRITLSDVILQLSGSRGEFPLGTSMQELMGFALRLAPNYIFVVVFGIIIYRHFCTASVYVFSRHSNRKRWYIKEISLLGLYSILFQVVVTVVAVIMAILRYDVVINKAGMTLFLIHIVSYSLWFFCLSLFMNVIALMLGSNTAFICVATFQMLCITALGLLQTVKKLEENKEFVYWVITLNPITRIILGWHKSTNESLASALFSKYDVLYFCDSLVVLIFLCCFIIVWGGFVISKHDLLAADIELGVI